MEEKKLFNVCVQGMLTVFDEDGRRQNIQVQIVLARFDKIEEAVNFFNKEFRAEFQSFATKVILVQNTER